MDIIYLLAASFARGGIKICIEHCNRLAGAGHAVSILGREPEPDWIEVGVPWRVEEGRLGERLERCDAVVFSFYEQAYHVMRPALESGAVPVYFAQGDEIIFGDPKAVPEGRERDCILAARASLRFPYPILTVSRAAAGRIEGLGGRDVGVVPNGIDRSVFKPSRRKNAVPRVLLVGSLYPAFKGIAEVLGALVVLHRGGVAFEAVWATPAKGGDPDLPFPVELHLNPSQRELAALYAGADVFVAASSNESFYLTPLEAMSCGTAVVCSDLPAVREYATPGEDFLAFAPGDAAALARQLRRLLRYPELRARFRERGLAVAEKMDWNKVILRLGDYLERAVARRGEIHAALREELRSPTVRWSFEGA